MDFTGRDPREMSRENLVEETQNAYGVRGEPVREFMAVAGGQTYQL